MRIVQRGCAESPSEFYERSIADVEEDEERR